MPILRNARHERFAQGIVKGLNGKAAYIDAGYRSKGNAAEVEASKFLRNPKIASRVAELQARQAHRLDISVERITLQLLEDRALAHSQGQAGAAVAASMALAKLHGLIIDRAEVISYRKPLREPSTVRQMSLEEWTLKFAPRLVEGPAPARPEPIEVVAERAPATSIADAIQRAKSARRTT